MRLSRKFVARDTSGPLLATIVFAALLMHALVCATGPCSLPSWTSWENRTIEADLDGDGHCEIVTLAGKRFSIRDTETIRYESPAWWLVSSIHVDDVTHDGIPDIVALTWKRGSYGSSRPFWVHYDPKTYSQHVFVFDYLNGKLEPLWMSSALDFEAAKASVDDAHRLHLVKPDGSKTLWEWQSWGFMLLENDPLEGKPPEEAASPSANGASPDEAVSPNASEASPDEEQSGGEAPSRETASQKEDAGDATSRQTRSITFLATGDVIAHDALYLSAWDPKARQYDFTNVFDEVRPFVKGFDLAAVNQETILVHDNALVSGYPEFGTPESLGDALVSTGFDVVLGATNHANDQGEQGLSDTLSFWSKHHPGITLLGLHESPEDAASLDIVNCKGMRIALFDYTENLNGHALPTGREFEIDTLDDESKLAADLRRAEGEADISICFLHAGEEYSDGPTPELRSLCERLVNAGADAIICSHPHVVQSAELLRTDAGAEGVVFWSLGNFVSWQTDPRTILGGCAVLTIEATDVSDAAGAVGADAGSAGDGSGSATANGHDKRARIASFELVPTICHLEPGLARPYLLEDYTEELAARHYLNTAPEGTPFTIESLEERFDTLR